MVISQTTIIIDKVYTVTINILGINDYAETESSDMKSAGIKLL